MDMLKKLRNQPSRVHAEAALSILQNDKLSFTEKLTQVQAQEDLASGYELELFTDIYSSLHNMAETDDEITLIAGTD